MTSAAEEPSATLNQTTRCKKDAREALGFRDIIDGLPPVWIALRLAVNESDAGHLAARLSDGHGHIPTDRVGVARGKIGIVRMQALHTARGAPYPATRAELRVRSELSVTLGSVASVSRIEGASELRVLRDLRLRVAHSASRLDARDTTMRQWAGEPIARWKRFAGVEDRGNLGDDGKPEVAAAEHHRARPQGSPDLLSENVVVALLGHHEGRMQSLTSVQ